ncbi:MAG: lysylphosphatidylglycerol synthase domain-containing protein [Planctomycetota bacterium]
MKLALRIAILIIVALGLAYAIQKSVQEWGEQQQAGRQAVAEIDQQLKTVVDPTRRASLQKDRNRLAEQIPQLSNLRFSFLVLGGCCYGLGLIPGGLHLRASLQVMGCRAPGLLCVKAQLLGHLGKYVPGKAMVVILRARELSKAGVPIAAGTTAVFMETLMMIAVGATVAGLTLLALPLPKWLAIACVCGGLLVSTLTFPAPLRLLLSKLEKHGKTGAMPSPTYRYSGWTWIWQVAAWIGFGVSFTLIAASLPGLPPDLPPMTLLAASVASITLAMVAGFVSLLPGGAGVRELVLAFVLAPVIGQSSALAAAILARFVFLTVELILGGVIHVWGRRNLG